MKRRHFLGISAAVTGALLGGPASSVRRHLGIGTVSAEDVAAVPRRAERVRGRIVSADGTTVSIRVVTRERRESFRVFVLRREYPAGDVLSEGRSDGVHIAAPDQPATVDVEVPIDGRDATRWFYEAYLVPALERDEKLAYLCESGPLRWSGESTKPVTRSADARDPVSRDQFARDRDGNDYVLRYRWRDDADEWRLRYRIRRSVHEAAVERERGYVRTFEGSVSNPIARDLAAAIANDATRVRGGERGTIAKTWTGMEMGMRDRGKSAWFESLVRFVQDLEYARDVETMGVYDYNRTVEETLVAGVGDCKDKTHLLAGLLAAPPLSCDTALLFQPAHVLLGVAAGDLSSPFDDGTTLALGGREFLPIDPSLRFDVGDYPDAPVTAAYGDGEWLHYDVEAIGRGLDRNVRDWFGHSAVG